jgi:PIN domain nuclease of toxin-antitoxin system
MILLDTHVLVWLALEPERLSRKAREAIRHARATTGIAIASISLFELAWLVENRRIQVAGSVEGFVRACASRVIVRPLTPEIAAHAVRFPATYPKDPQDRIIGATCIIEGIRLVSADNRIRASGLVETIW